MNRMPARTSIIILNWNTCEMTRACLESVFAATKGPDYEVIVVDNASGDDSVGMLRGYAQRGKIRLVENKENVGFSRGNNQAFGMSKGDYVYLLNADTLVDEGWLEEAVKAAESEERIAAVGSFLYHPTEKPTSDTRVVEKMTVGGAGMLIKRKALDEIGCLDAETFTPYYGEEIDWCYRARNRGWKIVQANASRVRHWGSVSTKKRHGREKQYELMFTNTYRAMLINLGALDLLRHVPGYLLIYWNAAREGLLGLHLKALTNNWRDRARLRVLRRQRRQSL